MGREFELKFAGTPELTEAMGALFGDLRELKMETTYFDTPEGLLASRHITLRRRLENGRPVCTMKTPEPGLGRGEWELEAEKIEDAAKELCKLSGQPELFSTLQGRLRPVCGAKFTRLCKEFSLPNFSAELAIDRGELLGGERRQPLCEVELELKKGSEEALLAFAQGFALAFGLKQEKKSKFKRALALANKE